MNRGISQITYLIVICCFIYLDVAETNSQWAETHTHTLILLRSRIPSLDIFIGGTTTDDFERKQGDFESLVLSFADAFCHYNFILPTETHLSLQNITFGTYTSCPTDFLTTNDCVQNKYSVQFDIPPYYLQTNELITLWKQIESSSKFRELGFKLYVIPKSQKLLIIVLSVIIVILLVAMLVIIYVSRNKLKEWCDCCSNRNETTSEEPVILTNNNHVSMKNHYVQQPVLPSPILHNGNLNTHQNGQKNQNQKIITGIVKHGAQNNGFIPEKTGTLGKTISSHKVPATSAPPTHEFIDDFDSEDETSFPSPLKAPPCPPRPPKKEPPPRNDSNNKPMHYMVTPIPY